LGIPDKFCYREFLIIVVIGKFDLSGIIRIALYSRPFRLKYS